MTIADETIWKAIQGLCVVFGGYLFRRMKKQDGKIEDNQIQIESLITQSAHNETRAEKAEGAIQGCENAMCKVRPRFPLRAEEMPAPPSGLKSIPL